MQASRRWLQENWTVVAAAGNGGYGKQPTCLVLCRILVTSFCAVCDRSNLFCVLQAPSAASFCRVTSTFCILTARVLRVLMDGVWQI